MEYLKKIKVVEEIIIPKAKWAHGRTRGPIGSTNLVRPDWSLGSLISTEGSYGWIVLGYHLLEKDRRIHRRPISSWSRERPSQDRHKAIWIKHAEMLKNNNRDLWDKVWSHKFLARHIRTLSWVSRNRLLSAEEFYPEFSGIDTTCLKSRWRIWKNKIVLHKSQQLLTLSLSERHRWRFYDWNLIGKGNVNRLGPSKLKSRRESMDMIALLNCMTNQCGRFMYKNINNKFFTRNSTNPCRIWLYWECRTSMTA
jgi:hypothetical protein